MRFPNSREENLKILKFYRSLEINLITDTLVTSISIFKVDGIDGEFQNSEKFFMYSKAKYFKDEEIACNIMKEVDPKECKRLGRSVRNFNDKSWSEVSDKFMLYGVHNKFISNNKLKEKLLSTGDKILIEASPYDSIWGVKMYVNNYKILYVDYWNGLNKLGFLLMEVRDLLRDNKPIPNDIREFVESIIK